MEDRNTVNGTEPSDRPLLHKTSHPGMTATHYLGAIQTPTMVSLENADQLANDEPYRQGSISIHLNLV